MNINDYLMSQRDVTNEDVIEDNTYPLAKRIVCADGFTLSVQASFGAYCRPRRNIGPWYEVEIGFPSARPSDDVMQYVEDPKDPTGTVYGYVPVELVNALIEEHGGMV